MDLKDIQEKLNTTKYNRFRFGISDDFQQRTTSRLCVK